MFYNIDNITIFLNEQQFTNFRFSFKSDIPYIDKALLYDNIYEELMFDTNKAKKYGLTIPDDAEFYWSLPNNFKGNMVRSEPYSLIFRAIMSLLLYIRE